VEVDLGFDLQSAVAGQATDWNGPKAVKAEKEAKEFHHVGRLHNKEVAVLNAQSVQV
jgi:hypothetical protein